MSLFGAETLCHVLHDADPEQDATSGIANCRSRHTARHHRAVCAREPSIELKSIDPSVEETLRVVNFELAIIRMIELDEIPAYQLVSREPEASAERGIDVLDQTVDTDERRPDRAFGEDTAKVITCGMKGVARRRRGLARSRNGLLAISVRSTCSHRT